MKNSFCLLIFCAALSSIGCQKQENVPGFTSIGVPPGEKAQVAPLTLAQKQDFSNLLEQTGRVDMAAAYIPQTHLVQIPTSLPSSQVISLANQMQATNCVITPFNTIDQVDSRNLNYGTKIEGNQCLLTEDFLFMFQYNGSNANLMLRSHMSFKSGANQYLDDVNEQILDGTGTIQQSGVGNDITETLQFKANGHISSLTRGTIQVSRTIVRTLHRSNQDVDSARFEASDLFTFSDHKVLLQQLAVQGANNNPVVAYFLNGEQINDLQYFNFIKLWGSQAQIVGRF